MQQSSWVLLLDVLITIRQFVYPTALPPSPTHIGADLCRVKDKLDKAGVQWDLHLFADTVNSDAADIATIIQKTAQKVNPVLVVLAHHDKVASLALGTHTDVSPVHETHALCTMPHVWSGQARLLSCIQAVWTPDKGRSSNE